MDIREILEYLPHRYPMLLLDRVLECEPGKRLLGLKNVTMNEKPDDKSVYYFAGIDEARFKRPVVPGDQLLLEVTVERSARGLWKFGAQARVGDALAAEAKILCTLRPI